MTAPTEPTETRSLDARLNDLLMECGRFEKAIYGGVGVLPVDSLRFLGSVGRLLGALGSVTSLDTYDDVIDALEDAV